MELNQLWMEFLKTGSPEAYLAYKQACKSQSGELNG